MTRINCIPVEELADQHLLIEYREITRVSKLARELSASELILSYRLGTGHVKFFYDKGLYLAKRTDELYAECLNRGFNPQRKKYIMHGGNLDNDWMPTENDIVINTTRLEEKMEMRPDFYRFRGIKVNSYKQINTLAESKQ